MAILTRTYKPYKVLITFDIKRDEFIEKLIPRPCMVVSIGLILAGFGIPVLMIVELLPITLWLAFVGFALALTGGVMALIFCGEI
jgi:hypothetical protein